MKTNDGYILKKNRKIYYVDFSYKIPIIEKLIVRNGNGNFYLDFYKSGKYGGFSLNKNCLDLFFRTHKNASKFLKNHLEKIKLKNILYI